MRVLWSLEQWATAIAELPTTARLPTRTVLVPNARVAHALRRELILTARADALIGTHFITLLHLASSLLLEAGEPHAPNDGELGAYFVRDAFGAVELRRFDRDDLEQLPGWDSAFARTLSELDGALLSPEACLASADPHVADVGRMHEFLRDQTKLNTVGAILRRAAAHAANRSADTPVLAVITGYESPAELSLVRALPKVVLAAWGVRPLRAAFLQRFEALAGERPSESRATLAKSPTSALQHLQACLFDEQVTTSAPADESVTIALYAGVHEEVDAAVTWVTRQILDHGVAAQDIAILTPRSEPYGALLRARLGALSSNPALTTFSEGGVPLCERADGARILLLIRTLRDDLSRDSLAPLLPILRPSDETSRIRGLAHAWEVLNGLAATSGIRAVPGAVVWPSAWEAAIDRLQTSSHIGGGLDERDQQRRAELQAVLRALAPAIDKLAGLFAAVNGESNEPLQLVWSRLQDFLEAHVKLPPATPPAVAALDQACAQFAGHSSFEPTGAAALAWIERTLHGLTVQSSRFGDPAVYLGTLAGARGLRFRAVRILGLAEGSVPSATKEDPVLPDAARAQLSPFLLSSRQRAHRQVMAFDGAVRCARECLCLSAPRASIEGSIRQPAAVLLDVMRALTGSNVELERALERAVARGRAHERDARDRCPFSQSDQLARIASGDLQAARAQQDPALALDALRSIRDRSAPSAQDGLLAGVLPASTMAGLSPERPISASRLATLMACPHRFLYEHILGFREPTEPLQTHSLNVMLFGIWLHLIAEEFWTEHGAVLAQRQGDLASAQAQLRTLASRRFEELQLTYPFINEHVALAERQALCDQLEKLLTLDWNDGKPQTFVAVERAFGYAGDCELDTEAGPLFVRGKIDKLDCIDGTLVVRDIKTGAGKPRRANDAPDLGVDLQLAVYAQVAKRMAHAWKTPVEVAVAYIFLRSGDHDRSWWGTDYAVLERATKTWLAAARQTLELGAFARSPKADDCKYCPFKPVCAPEMHRAVGVLDDPRVPERLRLLKRPEGA